MTVRPDPTFYASPKMAMEAPVEKLAFTLMLSPDGSQPDGLAVVDVDPNSKSYGKIVHTVMMPNKGDEFHHFGWNACSSALSPLTGHAFLERRYLIIPGIRSSRIYVIDVKEPLKAKIHKIIEPEELFAQDRLFAPAHDPLRSRGHLCLAPLAAAARTAPTALRASSSWIARPSRSSAATRWTAASRTSTTISGGTCRATTWSVPNGACRRSSKTASCAEDLLSNKYGHTIHFWDLRARKNVQTIDLGANHQMALEIRPAHDPVKEYGFCGVVVDTTNLQGAIFTWWRNKDGTFEAKKTITIDPVPADPDDLPDLLKGFGAVPPLVTDIDLSLDDKYLYVACWGLGEMHQYDVSDPMNPKLAGKVQIGGIVAKTKHPNGKTFGYGPQMVEISRDGKRVYWTNSLYSTWDDQFYPGDRGAAMVMANVGDNGGLTLDKDFWVDFPKGYRSHQIRLEGGDCSTDSFCYPSV